MGTLLRTLRHRNGSVIEHLDLGIHPRRKMSTSLMRNEGNDGRREITGRSSSLGDVDAVLSRCGSNRGQDLSSPSTTGASGEKNKSGPVGWRIVVIIRENKDFVIYAQSKQI